jgi:ribosomal-protein-alanine N-acetyltransferase
VTPDDLAALHARAFAPVRGWTAQEFASLSTSPHVTLLSRSGGFALVRTVAGEAELLTLAVDPDRRRRGIAEALLREWMSNSTAQIGHLEVAEDNAAALALYRKLGFAASGRRKSYYSRPGAPAVDALLMQVAMSPGHKGKTPPGPAKTG